MENSCKTSRFVMKYAKRLRCFTRMVPQMDDKHKHKENRSYCFQMVGEKAHQISVLE